MKNTRRVKFIDSAATVTTQYVRGQSYELKSEFAGQMVKAGAAVFVEEDEKTISRGKRDAVVSDKPAR